MVAALAAKPAIARRVSQIDVRDAANAIVILSGDSTVLYLGQDRFLQRIESYLELGPALRERVPAIDYIDLRFDEARRPGVFGASTSGPRERRKQPRRAAGRTIAPVAEPRPRDRAGQRR